MLFRNLSDNFKKFVGKQSNNSYHQVQRNLGMASNPYIVSPKSSFSRALARSATPFFVTTQFMGRKRDDILTSAIFINYRNMAQFSACFSD